jgi:uracil-DNA glycosylase family 4
MAGTLRAQLLQWVRVRQALLGPRCFWEEPARAESGSGAIPDPGHASQQQRAQAPSVAVPNPPALSEELPLPVLKPPRFRMPVVQPSGLFAQLPPWQQSQTLEELYEHIHTCTACPLGLTRTNFVFGTGNPQAEIVVIGEAPGAEEDARGEPFVGAAGQLLTRMLAAIGLQREEVYICNILKCRPPGNRRPLPQEVATCRPYLWKQLELIQPAFLLVLGATAASALLEREHKIAELRGRPIPLQGMLMVVTYHPAALLRNPQWKRPAWEDLQLLRQLYDAYRARRASHPA